MSTFSARNARAFMFTVRICVDEPGRIETPAEASSQFVKP